MLVPLECSVAGVYRRHRAPCAGASPPFAPQAPFHWTGSPEGGRNGAGVPAPVNSCPSRWCPTVHACGSRGTRSAHTADFLRFWGCRQRSESLWHRHTAIPRCNALLNSSHYFFPSAGPAPVESESFIFRRTTVAPAACDDGWLGVSHR